MVVQHSKQI